MTLSVTDSTGNRQEVKTVQTTGGEHMPVHVIEKDLTGKYFAGTNKLMGASEEKVFLIQAPTGDLPFAKVKISANGSKGFAMTLFENPSVSAFGSTVTLQSCNRFVTEAANSVVYEDAELNSNGTAIGVVDECDLILKNDEFYVCHIFSVEADNLVKLKIEITE